MATDEDETFRKLRKISFVDMQEALSIFIYTNISMEEFNIRRDSVLRDCGWTLDEYIDESIRRMNARNNSSL